MPAKALLYQAQFNGAYEWTSTYYSDTDSNFTDANLEDITIAHGDLQCDNIQYDHWDVFDAAGNYVRTYIPTLGGGTVTGDMMPIKYAMFIRLNSSPSIQRPSSKYIHGFPESFQADGSLTSAGNTALDTYGTVLNGASITDSEGNPVDSVSFRGFSRRKKMRRKP